MLGRPQGAAMTSTTLETHDAQAPLPEIRGFKLIRLINRGGMSSVYLGEQIALGREVAIKVMAPHALADETSRRRFENEVRTIARLEHPHVVRIYDVGRTSTGLPYYTMPHLARGHLGRRNFKGDEARVIAILRILLSALDYAHSHGVVHRDVKAENVLFDEADRPLLAPPAPLPGGRVALAGQQPVYRRQSGRDAQGLPRRLVPRRIGPLIQNADRAEARDRSLIGGQVAGHQAQQRALARAVATDDAGALRPERQAQIVEKRNAVRRSSGDLVEGRERARERAWAWAGWHGGSRAAWRTGRNRLPVR